MKSNIFITGFSGSGKTTVGRIVAQQLGWRFVDIDEVISGGEGTSIEAIFSTLGERHFRRLERDRLSSAAQGTEQVISTGGGVPVDMRNRRVMESNGLVACLEARPETIRQRLLKQSSEEEDPAARPMLADADPAKRIRTLKAERQPSYSLAHWTVHTDSLTPSEAADEVVRGWRVLAGSGGAVGGREDGDLAALVKTSSGDYPVWVGWNILDSLGERVKERLSPGTAYIVSDEGAFRQARRAQAVLETSGIPAHMLLLAPGEQSKTLESAQHVYGWLAGRKAERDRPGAGGGRGHGWRPGGIRRGDLCAGDALCPSAHQHAGDDGRIRRRQGRRRPAAGQEPCGRLLPAEVRLGRRHGAQNAAAAESSYRDGRRL